PEAEDHQACIRGERADEPSPDSRRLVGSGDYPQPDDPSAERLPETVARPVVEEPDADRGVQTQLAGVQRSPRGESDKDVDKHTGDDDYDNDVDRRPAGAFPKTRVSHRGP